MQYDVVTPDEYLRQLDDDWRKDKLLHIRSLILKNSPSPKEFIQYKMLTYGSEDNTVFHLNAQKNYVSLYIGNVDKVENARELLKGFDLGKGCIRFKKSSSVDSPHLKKIIDKVIEIWRIGGDLAC